MSSPGKTSSELIEDISLLQQKIRDLEEKETRYERKLTALIESEERYRNLFSELSDPTFALTPEGKFVYVNKAFVDGVGRPEEDVIGKTVWDISSREQADQRFRHLLDVFRTGVEKFVEVRVPRPDGDRYYITTISPVKNKKAIRTLSFAPPRTSRNANAWKRRCLQAKTASGN